MKRFLLTASFLVAATLALPALAIDIQAGGRGDDDDIDLFIGTPEDVPANETYNPYYSPNARLNLNGLPVRQIQLRAAFGTCDVPAAFIGPPCPPTAFVIIDGQGVAGTPVFTTDNVQVGVIYGAGTTVDAETVMLVELSAEWMTEIAKIAVRLPFLYQSDDGFVIATSDADLRESIAVALEGVAEAQENPVERIRVPGETTPGGVAPTPAP